MAASPYRSWRLLFSNLLHSYQIIWSTVSQFIIHTHIGSPTILNRSRWARIEHWPDITLDSVVTKLLSSACPSNHGLTETTGWIEWANWPVSPVRQTCYHCFTIACLANILWSLAAALYCLSGQPICNLVTWNSHVRRNPHKFYIIIELLKVPVDL
jgi:hypothetical protein